MCRRFPDAFERMARGDLHLCALCALASHLNEQNATELFEASAGKTRRQVEELLAARFPRPDVREQIRRLPARVQTEPRCAILARNGSSDAPNLRLLCMAHNLLHARKCFGKSHIEAKVAARNSGAAEHRPR